MALPVLQFTAVDRLGNIVPGALVSVISETTGLPVSLYADRAGTILTSNPVAADVDGFVRVFAAIDFYRIVAVGAGAYREWRYVAVGGLDSLPSGGTAGQTLIKNSNNSYDFVWADRREILAANPTYYVGFDLGSVSISNASPAVVTKVAHGLGIGSRVSFSILPFRTVATMTIASPAVVTQVGHGYSAGQPVVFNTTDTLPTGVTAGTTYFVIATGLTADTFQFSASVGGAAINTSGTQAGSHYCSKTGTIPSGLTAGTDYFVIAAGLTADAFQVSATSGGAAINTTTAQSGTINCRTGSDSNTGLINSAAGAFLTIQKAIDTTAGLDINSKTVTIQVANGMYTGAVGLKNALGFATAGNLVLQGNTTYPGNVLISTTNASAIGASNLSSIWDLKGLKITTTTAGFGIVAVNSTVRVGNFEFGGLATGYSHIYADVSKVYTIGSYTISGPASVHAHLPRLGYINVDGIVVTILNNPTFDIYASSESGSHMSSGFTTYTGKATGPRFSLNFGGSINTYGGGLTYLPGSSAGFGNLSFGGFYG